MRYGQARLQPGRRWRNLHVAKRPPDVARAALQVLDAHVDGLVGGALRFVAGDGLSAEDRGHLACDPVHGKQVGPVRRRLELEHLVVKREDVRERRSASGPRGR